LKNLFRSNYIILFPEAADVDGGDAERPGASLGPDWMDILNVSSAKQVRLQVNLGASPLSTRHTNIGNH